MSFSDCIKRKFNCVAKTDYDSLKSQLDASKQENIKLQNQIISLNKKLELYIHHKDMYKDLPTIDEMLADGRAIKVTTADIQRKVENQFGMKLKMSDSSSSEWGKTAIRWVEEGYANVRLPWFIVNEILKRSPLNYFEYSEGHYICNDFARSLNSEINLGPYWEAIWGVVRVKNHRVNLIWLSDYDDMIYAEPQADYVWLPNMNNEKDIPKELIL